MSHPEPSHINAMLQRAITLQRQGELAKAGALYVEVLKAHPDHPDCLNLLGVLAAHAKNHATALALIDRAIAVFPVDESFHNNRGNVLRELGQFEAALASFDQAIAIKSDWADSHFNRGVALQDLDRHAAAVASYDTAIAIDARHAHAWYNRGNALRCLGDPGAAVDSYDQAVSVDPAYVQACVNRGLALHALGQPEAAIASFDKAISLDPASAEAYYNRGIVQKALADLDAALASFDQAIRLRPDDWNARWNKSLVLLLRGNLREGWEMYESRWKTDSFKAPRRHFDRPLWQGGESLEGKTILLHNDQGLGDALQFCRYAIVLHGLGARVVLEVSQPLVALLRTIDGVAEVIRAGEPLPDFDFHCPLSSLPLALRTDMDAVPVFPTYLHGDASKVHAWSTRLGRTTRTRVGLVVSGNPNHANDANRSVGFADMLRYLPEGPEYVLLQKDLRDADKVALASRPDVLDVSASLTDFSETAALCELMDVVISVDTSVAHLAAAMGKNTWILLPFVPDWRWLMARPDSIWYPSARLYRQASPGAWTDVFCRVGADLRALGHIRR